MIHVRRTSAARRRLGSALHHQPKHRSTHAKHSAARAQATQHSRETDGARITGKLTGFLGLAQRHPLVDLPVLRHCRLHPHHGWSRSPLTTGLAPPGRPVHRARGVWKMLRPRGQGCSGSSLTDTAEGPHHKSLNS
jgi:hypothetical protein